MITAEGCAEQPAWKSALTIGFEPSVGAARPERPAEVIVLLVGQARERVPRCPDAWLVAASWGFRPRTLVSVNRFGRVGVVSSITASPALRWQRDLRRRRTRCAVVPLVGCVPPPRSINFPSRICQRIPSLLVSGVAGT